VPIETEGFVGTSTEPAELDNNDSLFRTLCTVNCEDLITLWSQFRTGIEEISQELTVGGVASQICNIVYFETCVS
jgi:hypothetical protein